MSHQGPSDVVTRTFGAILRNVEANNPKDLQQVRKIISNLASQMEDLIGHGLYQEQDNVDSIFNLLNQSNTKLETSIYNVVKAALTKAGYNPNPPREPAKPAAQEPAKPAAPPKQVAQELSPDEALTNKITSAKNVNDLIEAISKYPSDTIKTTDPKVSIPKDAVINSLKTLGVLASQSAGLGADIDAAAKQNGITSLYGLRKKFVDLATPKPKEEGRVAPVAPKYVQASAQNPASQRVPPKPAPSVEQQRPRPGGKKGDE
ncbi:MAG: hypothetical protein ACHQJ6_03605 [Candidatus Berkiellales bacterium]